MACICGYQRLNPGLMKILTKCCIVSEGSERSSQCWEISLCPGSGRKGTLNKLTPQSSVSKVARARDRLCQEKCTHTCAHTHHRELRAFTPHCQCQMPMRAAHSYIVVYLSSCFCYWSLVHCCSVELFTCQVVCLVLSSWPK